MMWEHPERISTGIQISMVTYSLVLGNYLLFGLLCAWVLSKTGKVTWMASRASVRDWQLHQIQSEALVLGYSRLHHFHQWHRQVCSRSHHHSLQTVMKTGISSVLRLKSGEKTAVVYLCPSLHCLFQPLLPNRLSAEDYALRGSA